jgi:hypothetical protein
MGSGSRRRSVVVGATTLALVIAGFVGVAAARAHAHQRDVPAFYNLVATYIGGDLPAGPADLAWSQSHPDLVLAEADRSCRWLDSQPMAPQAIDPTGYHAYDSLMGRYLDSTRTSAIAQVSDGGRMTIVGSAWAHLCSASPIGRVAPRHAHNED